MNTHILGDVMALQKQNDQSLLITLMPKPSVNGIN